MTDSYDELVETLAELEHEQWCYWTQNLADREDLPAHLIERWEDNWIPYGELDDETKEHDRKWARQAVSIVNSDGEDNDD